ncbi:MAG TPA: TIGR03118 family protein, partial [Flavisolibacter sp.]|nr:TIGR03118 family protein [Flavisolibacter sp.]
MLKSQLPKFLIIPVALFFFSCQKNQSITQNGNSTNSLSANLKEGKKIGRFTQTNLVSDVTGMANRTDPTLINAWGLAWAPSGIAWIGSQAGHVSDVYDREGNTILGPVNIPSPGASTGGNPTGVVFNPSSGFTLTTGGPARFIFVGVDGVISAWNGAQGTHAARVATVPNSAFTGVTIASNGADTLLYAANFAAGKINVWNKSWAPVNLSFMDRVIPRGFSPFNIQN